MAGMVFYDGIIETRSFESKRGGGYRIMCKRPVSPPVLTQSLMGAMNAILRDALGEPEPQAGELEAKP